MHKLTRNIYLQLRILHHPVKEQTLRIPLVKRNALASGIHGSALVAAAFEGAVGFLLGGFRVVAGDYGVTGDTAEREAYGVCLGMLV